MAVGAQQRSKASSTAKRWTETSRRHRSGAPGQKLMGRCSGLLTKLKQICNHPALASMKGHGEVSARPPSCSGWKKRLMR